MESKLEPKDVLEVMKSWTVLELSEFVKLAEEEFGVSAAAPAVQSAVPVETAEDEKVAGEEKTQYDVILVSTGDKKIPVIKEIRAITNLGLKEAKALVEEAPNPVKEGITKEEAEKMKKQLEEAGATVEIK
ncbi:MAG: 50S ribosomal protein L7/L12 [Actinomycetota bacterium]|nr:50S ribosomal protein L7/L12 [Actinomycetota bacterium]